MNTVNNYHAMNYKDVIKTLDSSIEGLTSAEARRRLQIYGPNELHTKNKTNVLKQFLLQFKDFMIIILIIAAVVSFVVSLLQGDADIIDPIIILVIIIFNAIIGFIQEAKAEHSLDSLKKLSTPYSNVIRDNVMQVIPSVELVPGDVIMLESGNFVPADARIIESVNLKVDESALTGESVPVSKNEHDVLSIDIPLAERHNMVYSSSIITYGHGKAVVCSTGIHSEVGKISKLISEDVAPDTPLQKNLAKTSKILGIVALFISLIIFIVGVIQGRGIFEMFMTSVSLAVASIPEGLPIIVTIVLALGVTKMAQNKAIIRKLPAVETLGSATYVCSDKTGTLTQNKMTVSKICDATNSLTNIDFILSLACLCNNSYINNSDTCESKSQKTNNTNTINITVHGEPTENALIYAGINNNLSKIDLDKRYKRIYEIPFDSKRKLMTTVHQLSSSSYRYITKGAPEYLLNKCTHYYTGTSIKPLSNSIKRQIQTNNLNMTKQALRVIAIAFKDSNEAPKDANKSEYESNLCFVGLIGMIDPPRKEAYNAVNQCISAGVTPIMITGDHPITAMAIAREIGITSNNSSIITGNELDKMDDDTLNKDVSKYKVYARVSPTHKVRIVKALQHNHEIVAMTGDGVNDAPALKAADIGCSMGIGGTDVAKNASDMILADDNFATIVEAVKQGRGIYENIRKSIHFLLSCNIGEIISILFAIIFSLPTPLLAVQLLWINLVTDSLPAIALGVEPITNDVMTRNHQHNNSFFTKNLCTKIITEGFLIGLITLIAFIIGYKVIPISHIDNLTTGRTMAFAVLGLSQLFHAFNMKSRDSLLHYPVFNNPKLIISFIICTFLQVSVISIPTLANIFKVITLDGFRWFIVFILAFLPIPVVELQKHFNHR